MCAESLRLVNRKTRKSRQAALRTSGSQQDDRMLYGGIFDFLKKKKKNDEELQDETSEHYAQTENKVTMESYIQDMIA